MKEGTIKLKASALTPEKAAFVQEQGEKALQRTIDDRDAIQRRGSFVLGVVAAVIAFGLGWATEHWGTLSPFLARAVVIESIFLILLSMPLIHCYLPSLYAGQGYDPDNLLADGFLHQPMERVRVGYTCILQGRIEANRKRNTDAACNLKSIATLLFVSPLLALFIAFFIGCFVSAS